MKNRRTIFLIACSVLLGVGVAMPASAEAPHNLGTFVEIRNFSTGQCLEVVGNSVFAGGRVATTPCNGGANQKWLVRYHPACLNSSTGQLTCWDYIFINLNSGMCADVPAGNPALGLQQFPCNSGTNQRFQVTWRPSTVGGEAIRSYVTTNSSAQPTAKVFSTGPNTNVSLGGGQDDGLNYWNGIPR